MTQATLIVRLQAALGFTEEDYCYEQACERGDSSFEQNVLQAEQPVLVDFWAEWCGPCRIIAPMVEAIAEQYADTARVVKLNVDEHPTTAGAYGIKGIPTLILFKDGKEAERIVGAIGKEALARLLNKHTSIAV